MSRLGPALVIVLVAWVLASMTVEMYVNRMLLEAKPKPYPGYRIHQTVYGDLPWVREE